MNEGKLRAIKLLDVKSERPVMICVYQVESGLRRRQVFLPAGKTLRESLKELSALARQ